MRCILYLGYGLRILLRVKYTLPKISHILIRSTSVRSRNIYTYIVNQQMKTCKICFNVYYYY